MIIRVILIMFFLSNITYAKKLNCDVVVYKNIEYAYCASNNSLYKYKSSKHYPIHNNGPCTSHSPCTDREELKRLGDRIEKLENSRIQNLPQVEPTNNSSTISN